MHPAVRTFSEELAKFVFARIDEGAPFVLFTVERRHTYVWDRAGRHGYGREAALPIMLNYISPEEAESFFDNHAEDAFNHSESLDAFVSAYWYRSNGQPSAN